MSETGNPSIIPLARAYRLKELPGSLAKFLDVPAGRQGVVLDSVGKARIFSSGYQRVVSAFERLRGAGDGLRAGYVPIEPFTANLQAGNLLSGDGELLDASLLCQVKVVNPACFFGEQVVPRGEFREAVIDLRSAALFDAFGALAHRYTAADLVQGLPTSRMAAELLPLLETCLVSQGLHLEMLQLLVFWRAENRLMVAQKVQELEQRLMDVELQAKMDELENQVQIDDFTRQFQNETVFPAGVRPVSQPGEPLSQTLRKWLNLQKKPQTGQQHWRIENLLRRSQKSQPESTKPADLRELRRFITGRVGIISVLLIVATCITAVMLWVASSAKWDVKWEFLLAVWVPVVGVFIQSLIAFLMKRAEIAELLWTKKGVTFLDDLSRNNRHRADRLVREQCSNDLAQIQRALRDVWQRLSRQNDDKMAVLIREIERKAHKYQEAALDMGFGSAPYLSDLKISRPVWERMLDEDEKLLVMSAVACEQASVIQQKIVTGESLDGLMAKLEAKLDALWNAFANRARAIKSEEVA